MVNLDQQRRLQSWEVGFRWESVSLRLGFSHKRWDSGITIPNIRSLGHRCYVSHIFGMFTQKLLPGEYLIQFDEHMFQLGWKQKLGDHEVDDGDDADVVVVVVGMAWKSQQLFCYRSVCLKPYLF